MKCATYELNAYYIHIAVHRYHSSYFSEQSFYAPDIFMYVIRRNEMLEVKVYRVSTTFFTSHKLGCSFFILFLEEDTGLLGRRQRAS
jgi:hypothetical protein